MPAVLLSKLPAQPAKKLNIPHKTPIEVGLCAWLRVALLGACGLGCSPFSPRLLGQHSIDRTPPLLLPYSHLFGDKGLSTRISRGLSCTEVGISRAPSAFLSNRLRKSRTIRKPIM